MNPSPISSLRQEGRPSELPPLGEALAGANGAASLALTLGVGAVTAVLVAGIFVAPSVIDCSRQGGSVTACLRTKLDIVLQKPVVSVTVPVVTPSVVPPASSVAIVPSLSALPPAPPA